LRPSILLAGEEDTDQCCRTEPIAIDQSKEEDDLSLHFLPLSELSELSSELSSSSSSESLSLESGLGLESEDTDEENTSQHMVDILQVVMETHVLNPHEVPKCLQLYLVLVQFTSTWHFI
jgi:hypothetical protein